VPRPHSVVVVTDPAAGVRPALPAGYGSGFEIGMPLTAQPSVAAVVLLSLFEARCLVYAAVVSHSSIHCRAYTAMA
jgi:hypothetical protein